MIVFLLAAGAALRLLYLCTPELDSDQAIYGLMARSILEGERPIFQWGFLYMGALEPYTAALWMLLIGPGRLALSLAPASYSMVFVAGAYLLGREVGGRRAGLWALALSAFPPLYLIWTSVLPRGGYIEAPALGTLALVGSLRALAAGSRREETLALAATGFLLGLAFWTHLLTVFYGAAILLLWLAQRPSLVGRAIVKAGIPFLIGSAPLWYETFRTSFATFSFAAIPIDPLSIRAATLVTRRLPIILGIYQQGQPGETLPGATVVLGSLHLASLATLVVASMRARSARHRAGARLLLAFGVAAVGIYLASNFSGANTQRYLVPLYSLFLVAPAVALARLHDRTPRLAVFLGLLLLFFHTLPTLRSATVLRPDLLADYRARREHDHRLFETLDGLGISEVYVHSHWDGPRLTFDAAERIVFATAFRERRPSFLDRVDAAEKVAFLFRHRSNSFEGSLRLAGASYERLVVPPPEGGAPYVLYHSFEPRPAGGRSVRPIEGRASENPHDALLSLDADVATRWTSLDPQRVGMWYEIDLGEIREITEIVFLPRFGLDAPAGLRIETSSDGETWNAVVTAEKYWGPLSWAAGRPIPALDGWVVARFSPVDARRVRLTLLGRNRPYAWSIAELEVRERGHAVATSAAPPPDGRGRLLADPVVAARLPQGVRRWEGELIRPHFEHLRDAFRVGLDDRLLLRRDRKLRPELGVVSARERISGEHRVVEAVRRDVDHLEALRPASWKFDPREEILRVELSTAAMIAGVRITAHDVMRFPRGLAGRFSASEPDRGLEETLVPRAEQLFWTHEGLFGASFHERIFLFEKPRQARFVEVRAAPRHPGFPWAPREVTVLAAPAR